MGATSHLLMSQGPWDILATRAIRSWASSSPRVQQVCNSRYQPAAQNSTEAITNKWSCLNQSLMFVLMEQRSPLGHHPLLQPGRIPVEGTVVPAPLLLQCPRDQHQPASSPTGSWGTETWKTNDMSLWEELVQSLGIYAGCAGWWFLTVFCKKAKKKNQQETFAAGRKSEILVRRKKKEKGEDFNMGIYKVHLCFILLNAKRQPCHNI